LPPGSELAPQAWFARGAGPIESPIEAGIEVEYDSAPIAGFDRAFTFDPFGNRVEPVELHASALR
jgi:hypothetical protein